MSAFKAIFLLSLLAVFLAPRQTEALSDFIKPEWSKFAKCSQLLVEALTHLAVRVVPNVLKINSCTGYVKPTAPKDSRNMVWYAKVTLDFLKKVVLDKPECLINFLNKATGTLQPYVDQIRGVGCLDENDFFI